MPELRDAKVKVMVLNVHSSISFLFPIQLMNWRKHTHTHASDRSSNSIQYRNHVTPFCYRRLQTGIESIAREEGEQLRLAGIFGI